MRAIETFDTNRGLAFSTYAIPWIKQRALRYWEENRTVVRYPAYLIQLNRAYNKLKTDHPDEDDEFYLRLMAHQHSQLAGSNVSPATILWAIKLNDRGMFTSIDKPIAGDDNNTSVHEILASMTDLREEHNNLVNFEKLFKVLTYREKFVLMERADGMTLADCSVCLDLSREMVRQIEKTAILKVRAAIRMREKSHLLNKGRK